MFVVILYVNHAAKEFSLTARKSAHAARLAEMEQHEAALGFTACKLAEGLGEAVAKQLKFNTTYAMQQVGYNPVTRQRTD